MFKLILKAMIPNNCLFVQVDRWGHRWKDANSVAFVVDDVLPLWQPRFVEVRRSGTTACMNWLVERDEDKASGEPAFLPRVTAPWRAL